MSTKKKRTTIFVHPYNGASEGAKTLTAALGGKRILTGGRSAFKYSKGKTVINWGSSEYHVGKDVPMLNPPAAVAKASNKLTFFQSLKGSSTRIVPFTTDVEEVQEWLNAGSVVCARTKLTGHSGEGLVILGDKEVDIASAKLYTKYVKKAREYRVHVVDGKVIRVQKKILRPELTERIRDPKDEFSKDDVNWEVRNHGNGFVYVTDGVEEDCPKDVLSQARSAICRTGLDFGAVDVIWSNKKQQAFVLEINCAPGLEGGTTTAYVDAFQALIANGVPTKKKTLKVEKRPWDTVNIVNVELWGGRACLRAVIDHARGVRNDTDWCNWSETGEAMFPYSEDDATRLEADLEEAMGNPPSKWVQMLAQDVCEYQGINY